MPTYVFKGRNRLNEIVVGERVADNRDALRQILRREQVTLTSVKEKGRFISVMRLRRMIAAARKDEEQERQKAKNAQPAPKQPPTKGRSVLAAQSLLQAKERVEQLQSQVTVLTGEIATRQAQRAATARPANASRRPPCCTR